MIMLNVRNRLRVLDGFGLNPGNLGAAIHLPPQLAKGSSLVVVLHGSKQDAETYNHGSGWSTMADECGFALLFPEQRRENNANLSFNWFGRTNTERDAGEPLSIRQMIEHVVSDLEIDPSRIFVTGLSSGGAMACVMLATYPEVFAGGAVIGGLPYRTANTVFQAMARMKGYGGPSDRQLGALVRDATAHSAHWPTISVWHGDRDTIVDPSNAEAIVRQWQALHGVEGPPTLVEEIDGHPRRVWRCPIGRDVIEAFRIAEMGHGTPLDTSGSNSCGAPGDYMLEVGVSSTRHIARFWGLTAPAGASLETIEEIAAE